MRAALPLLVGGGLTGCGEARPHLPAPRGDTLEGPSAPCEGQTIDMRVSGHVWTPVGAPVVDVAIGRWDVGQETWVEEARTDAEGRFEFDQTGPAWVALRPWPSEPPAWCVAIPERVHFERPEGAEIRFAHAGNDFLSPPACLRTLTIDRPDGDVEVTGWHDGRAFSTAARLADGAVRLPLPCATEALIVTGPDWTTTPAPTCPAPGPSHCISPPPADVDLPTADAATLSVTVQDPDGVAMVGALVSDGVRAWRTARGGRVDLVAAPGTHVVVRAPGRTLAYHQASAADTSWVARMEAGRAVRVRCPDALDGRCLGLPTCRSSGDAGSGAPCWVDEDGHAACSCPATQAELVWPGHVASVDPEAVQVDVEFPGVTLTGVVQDASACRVWATRRPRWRDLVFDPPRTWVQQGRCRLDGSFEVAPLSPGTWDLSVRVQGGRTWTGDAAVSSRDVSIGTVVAR